MAVMIPDKAADFKISSPDEARADVQGSKPILLVRQKFSNSFDQLPECAIDISPELLVCQSRHCIGGTLLRNQLDTLGFHAGKMRIQI